MRRQGFVSREIIPRLGERRTFSPRRAGLPHRSPCQQTWTRCARNRLDRLPDAVEIIGSACGPARRRERGGCAAIVSSALPVGAICRGGPQFDMSALYIRQPAPLQPLPSRRRFHEESDTASLRRFLMTIARSLLVLSLALVPFHARRGLHSGRDRLPEDDRRRRPQTRLDDLEGRDQVSPRPYGR